MEKITNCGTDIPELMSTSSVGSIEWPPTSASENRKKGVFRTVIKNKADLKKILSEWSVFPFDQETSRFSARFFLDNNLLTNLDYKDRLFVDPFIEGIIPLAKTGIPELEETSIIYLGKNSPSRVSSGQVIKEELDAARNIFNSSLNNFNHIFGGYHVEILHETRKRESDLQKQFNGLYSAFGWSEEDVRKILTNPNNILAAAFDDDLLISAGIAERAQLEVGVDQTSVDLVMYEITEAATREEYRRNGIYTEVAITIMKYLAKSDVNLVYAESNLIAPGVLKSAARQGRHSVLETFDRFGFTPKPLSQHVRISGGKSDNRPPNLKNDLLVTFIPRQEIIERYG